MAWHVMKACTFLFVALSSVNAYWLMGIEDFITTERIDPIVNPGRVSGHVHSVLGGSNFRMNTNTGALRQSQCTSVPIPEDKSNYWFPHLYFQWANGSFTSLDGGAVMLMYDASSTLAAYSSSELFIDYLFSDTPGTTTAFPDDFRMLTGDPTLRTYDSKSYAQQAVTFLCLDFNGVSTRFNSLPSGNCASGIRAQINFPSCWDGKNTDSSDHKSHVAFPSGGPDSGTCSDPKFPVTLPRIFLEVYWSTNNFDNVRSQAMNSAQPFVYSYGDPTGYGYHADFLNGWDKGVLQKAVDGCHCNPYGDPTCCVDQGIFHMNHEQTCRITKAIDETTTGTLNKLPGNNPVQKEGPAKMFTDPNIPALLSPIYAYTGNSPAQVGTVIAPPASGPATASSARPSLSSSANGASTTLMSRSLSSIALRPSSSVGVVPSSDMPVSSKPAVTVIPSFVPSAVPSLSVVPPALISHSADNMTSATVRSSLPSPSDVDEEDCEEEDDIGADVSTQSAIPASTNTVASPITSSAHSTSVPVSSASSAVSQSTLAPVQGSTSEINDEDCEEEEGAETDGSTSSSPPSSGSGFNDLKPVFVGSVQLTTTAVSASSTSAGNIVPVASVSTAHPACATGKFRHKRLREQKAQPEKRSFQYSRSFHDRFVRSHHARAF